MCSEFGIYPFFQALRKYLPCRMLSELGIVERMQWNRPGCIH
jgi:hypothetical protein